MSRQKMRENSAFLSSFWGDYLTREEIMLRINADEGLRRQFLQLTEPLQEEMLAFCMGVKGMKMTYDVFFKHILDPMIYPERMESFIGECLRQKVKIVTVLPNEGRRLMAEGSLVEVDILVRLQDGSLVNVEIQKVGYLFPGARCACYSSDLLIRQYSQIRSNRQEEQRTFSYGEIKKVYTIVLMQQSIGEFHRYPEDYLHYSKQTFNTGLDFDLLQEYLLIPLDIFLKNPHNELTRLDAWLYFIGSDRLEDVEKVVMEYPEFAELYKEVFRFRYQVKELVGMFSEILYELDKNTAKLMIEEQQQEIEALRKREEEQQELIKSLQAEVSRLKEQQK